MTLRKPLIILNTVGVLVFVVLWFHAAWLAPIGATGRVTELDRNGVFDVPKLTAYNAVLASNLRYKVAAWIAERDQQASVFNAVVGLVVCIVNLIIAMASGRPRTAVASESAL